MAHEITIPRLGWSMEEGVFVGWLKKDGDFVKRGDTLFELEGEKASQEIESVDEGILRIPASAPAKGATVLVGAVIGFLTAEGEVIPQTNSASSAPKAAPPETPSSVSNANSPAGPAARRRARELGVPLTEVQGSGPRGRVLSDDVKRLAEQQAAPPATHPISSHAISTIATPRAKRVAKELGIRWQDVSGSGAGGRVREEDIRAAAKGGFKSTSGKRVPISNRRRVIAQRMVASRQATVPVTLTSRADATNLVNLRAQFKASGRSSTTPSYQDIITKLVAEVLLQHRLLAARWEEKELVLPDADAIHLGMAVDTDEGLLVPVIRNVVGLSLAELAAQSQHLAAKSRGGNLTLPEMQGGVFTITNLGAFGIDAFTPVINSPETAILGLGAIRREPVVLDDGQIVARHQLTLSLTFDHRVLDGAPAARFLQTLGDAIANPSAWLLGN